MEKILPQQLKAARTLAGLSQAEVCERAGLSLVTLRRLESQLDYAHLVAPATVGKVKEVLAAAGIIFFAPGEVAGGCGVALRDPN